MEAMIPGLTISSFQRSASADFSDSSAPAHARLDTQEVSSRPVAGLPLGWCLLGLAKPAVAAALERGRCWFGPVRSCCRPACWLLQTALLRLQFSPDALLVLGGVRPCCALPTTNGWLACVVAATVLVFFT